VFTGCTLCGGAHESGCCISVEESTHEVNYMGNQPRPDLHERTTKLEETLAEFMQVSMSNHKSTELSIKNLEIQVGQLAKQIDGDKQQLVTKPASEPEDNFRELEEIEDEEDEQENKNTISKNENEKNDEKKKKKKKN